MITSQPLFRRRNRTTPFVSPQILFLVALGIFASASVVSLAAVPENPPPAVVVFSDQSTHPSGSQAPGEQFILFGANAKPGTGESEDPAGNLHKLQDFSVTVPLSGGKFQPPPANDQDAVNVIAPGGAVVRTGILGTNRGSEGYVEMVSFRLLNPAVTSFSVWVLDSTVRQKGNANDGLAIRVNGGAPQAARETAKTDLSNQFTKFTVTGASMSDVFTVSVLRQTTQHANYRTLAGLTFSAAPDPALAGKKFPVIEQDGWLDLNKNGKKDAFEDPTRPLEKRVENLLSQMTMEEKLGQLNQLVVPGDGREKDAEFFPLMRRGEVSSYIWGCGVPATRNQFQRIAVRESRLGIPIIFGMDIIHGAHTLFPISLGLACSFDPELFERAQTVAARETRAEGVEWAFAPMCDLARDPRWGRVSETCGEDPYLSSLCNAAQVRGFQGTNPAAPDRIAACLKHFVGYSAVTGGRDYNDSEINDWTLRNAHLPPFHAGVNAGALTIMSSFNVIGGIPAVADRRNLTGILRDEWKFRGFVVSDWLAVKEQINWGYAKDPADAARLAINAGNDMDMWSKAYLPNLAQEVKEGRVSQATVDEAVRRVLRVKFQVGLFERPYVDELAYPGALKKPEDLALARECVTKSVVMVKNTGILPIAKEAKKFALIGPVGDDHREILGSWTGRTSWSRDTLASALKDALPPDATLTVVKGCAINTVPTTKTLQDGRIVPDENAPPTDADLQIDAAVAAAMDAEVVIMAVGETRGWSGENASRAFLTLTGNQQALFDAVAATGKPLVTIVFSGRPLALPEVWEKSAAVLYAWQPGIEAGNGLADLLLGKVAPSARLSMSVPRDVAQVPIFYNHYNTGRPRSGQYRDMKDMDAKFWFGFGLTYTTFEYGPVTITPPANDKPAAATVTITNTGKREGVEVPQLYIRQLVCHEGARPKQELRGFKRVTLQPGGKAEVSFPLTGDVLGYVDRKGEHRVDHGDYEIWIAPSAHNGKPMLYSHL